MTCPQSTIKQQVPHAKQEMLQQSKFTQHHLQARRFRTHASRHRTSITALHHKQIVHTVNQITAQSSMPYTSTDIWSRPMPSVSSLPLLSLPSSVEHTAFHNSMALPPQFVQSSFAATWHSGITRLLLLVANKTQCVSQQLQVKRRSKVPQHIIHTLLVLLRYQQIQYRS